MAKYGRQWQQQQLQQQHRGTRQTVGNIYKLWLQSTFNKSAFHHQQPGYDQGEL